MKVGQKHDINLDDQVIAPKSTQLGNWQRSPFALICCIYVLFLEFCSHMFNHVHTLCQHRHVQSTQPSTSNSTQVVMKRLVVFPGITAPQLAGESHGSRRPGPGPAPHPRRHPATEGAAAGHTTQATGEAHPGAQGRNAHQARTNTYPKRSNDQKGTDTHQKRAKCEERSYTYQA